MSDRLRQRIEDLDDVREWIAEHDGRIDAYWKAQFKLNDRNEEKMGAISHRLTIVERKVWQAAGFAAAAGSIVGAFLSGLIKATG